MNQLIIIKTNGPEKIKAFLDQEKQRVNSLMLSKLYAELAKEKMKEY
jgi:hypothetical protein